MFYLSSRFSLLPKWWENDEVPVELLIAVATFGFVTAITPGPNNTYLLASGAKSSTGPQVSCWSYPWSQHCFSYAEI
jgi:hypothetical protein